MSAPIRIRGARAHNLRALDLDLPRQALVAVTGVSGSGKTSLVVGTLARAGQWRFLEALSPRLRRRFGEAGRPEVDLVSGLPPTVTVAGSPPAGRRDTVGTVTEVHELLRVLFAHRGTVHCDDCGAALAWSTADEIADEFAALPDGTRITLLAPVGRARRGDLTDLLEEIARQGFTRVRLDGATHRVEALLAPPLSGLDRAEPPALDARRPHDLDVVVDRVRAAPEKRDRLAEAAQTAFAAGRGRIIALIRDPNGAEREVGRADHPWCARCARSYPVPRRVHFSFLHREGACPACRGTGLAEPEGDPNGPACGECHGGRLGPEARRVFLGGRNLPELEAAAVHAIRRWLADLSVDAASGAVVQELNARLAHLVELGLGHLPPGRAMAVLSSTERRRVALAAATASELLGALYAIDEPAAGMAAPEAARVARLLRRLSAAGSTVVVTDHHPEVLRAADEVVELGPGAGDRGGRLVRQGPPAAFVGTDTATGRALDGRLDPPKATGRAPAGRVRVTGARGRNLRGVDATLPLGTLVAVTGPGGSGKTALLALTIGRALDPAGPPPLPHDTFAGSVRRLVRPSRAPLARTFRSCVATASGLWEPVRQLLACTREARVRGFGPDRFSFNRPGGRCPVCKGTGFRQVRAEGLIEVELPCETCEGRRFDRATLAVRWRGISVDGLLAMRVDAARRLFADEPRIGRILAALDDVGLGHLVLGQPTPTLSGGESWRLRLATELATAADPRYSTPLCGTVFLLDHPTAGLHPLDAVRLVDNLQRLVDRGATVWAETHDPILVEAADAVLTMGPGAGPEGGRLT